MITQARISRRHLLGLSAAAGGAAASGLGAAPAQERRPFPAEVVLTPRIDRFDPALDNIISTSEPIREIASGFGGPLSPAEGPLWWKEGGYLLFSDIHASKRMKYTPGQGMTVFQENTHQANGLTRDLQGRSFGLRARDAPGDPPGAGRLSHGDRQQLPGPPPQSAERRHCEVRRLDLFHRSVVEPACSRAMGSPIFRRLSAHARSRRHHAPS
jgi:hypothetical protein